MENQSYIICSECKEELGTDDSCKCTETMSVFDITVIYNNTGQVPQSRHVEYKDNTMFDAIRYGAIMADSYTNYANITIQIRKQ